MSDVIAWTVRSLQGRVRVPDVVNLPHRVYRKK